MNNGKCCSKKKIKNTYTCVISEYHSKFSSLLVFSDIKCKKVSHKEGIVFKIKKKKTYQLKKQLKWNLTIKFFF